MFAHNTKLYFILLIFFISPVAKAGDSLHVARNLKDELKVSQLRQPDSSFFNTYLADEEYAYSGKYIPPGDNTFFERLWRGLLRFLSKGLKILKIMPVLSRIILAVAVIFLLYLLVTKTKFYKLFYTDKEIPAPDFDEIDMLTQEYDFGKAIAILLSQQNYRGAIRILHLKLLKDLEIHELIRYSKEKTNREYSREISDLPTRNVFIALTGIYNKIWYGNYPLSGEEYKDIESEFNQFSARLNESME